MNLFLLNLIYYTICQMCPQLQVRVGPASPHLKTAGKPTKVNEVLLKISLHQWGYLKILNALVLLSMLFV